MAKVVIAVLFLCTVSMCTSSNKATFYGLEGNNISIPITRPSGIDEILCTLKDNKVLEWEEGQEVSYFGKFIGRTNLTMDTMEIKNLQQTDSGTYKLSFIYSNGSAIQRSFLLIVNTPLLKPTINCTANGTNVRLECNYEDDLSTTTQWIYQGSIVGQHDNFDLSLGNKSLTVFNPEESAGEYACILKQPGDQAQSDPINIEKCYSRGNSRQHVILIVFVMVLLFLCIIGICVYCWNQKKKGVSKMDTKHQTQDPKNVSPEGDGIAPQPLLSGEPEDRR